MTYKVKQMAEMISYIDEEIPTNESRVRSMAQRGLLVPVGKTGSGISAHNLYDPKGLLAAFAMSAWTSFSSRGDVLEAISDLCYRRGDELLEQDESDWSLTVGIEGQAVDAEFRKGRTKPPIETAPVARPPLEIELPLKFLLARYIAVRK